MAGKWNFVFAILAACLPVSVAHASYGDSTGPSLAQYHRASLWASHVAGSESWTRAVVAVVQARLADFDRAADAEAFCPGYSRATREQRTVCWLRLVGGVVSFESSFRPDEPPFNEGNGVYSVGLLALSTGECPNAATQRDLMNPVQNLVCGVNKMASLIARGGAIDNPAHSGASAYWSTLRPAHRKWDPTRRHWLNLGKKSLIEAFTRSYRSY